jgi:hypothetical protein
MSGRLAQGKDNGDIIMYCGFNVQNSPLNQINCTRDFKVAQVQAVYNRLTPAIETR